MKNIYFFIILLMPSCNSNRNNTEVLIQQSQTVNNISIPDSIPLNYKRADIINNAFSYNPFGFSEDVLENGIDSGFFAGRWNLHPKMKTDSLPGPGGIYKYQIYSDEGFKFELAGKQNGNGDVRMANYHIINNPKIILANEIRTGMPKNVFLKIFNVENTPSDTIKINNEEGTNYQLFIFKNDFLYEIFLGSGL